MKKHGRIEEPTTIKVEKKVREIANISAKKQGLPLYEYLEKIILGNTDIPCRRITEKMEATTQITCTDCCLEVAQNKVTEIMPDKKIRIKYLCHHCYLLEN